MATGSDRVGSIAATSVDPKLTDAPPQEPRRVVSRTIDDPGAAEFRLRIGQLAPLCLRVRPPSLALHGGLEATLSYHVGCTLQSAMAKARALPPVLRQGLLGVVTPLLPCGLSWAACGGAAVAGSGFAGGGVMVGLALGSLPLLFLAQTQSVRLLRRFGPRKLAWVQRGAMLSAAGLLVWRGLVSMQGGGCCH